MHIALVSGLNKPISFRSKGGVEVWSAGFIREMAKRGHSIDVYATIGDENHKNINYVRLLPKPLPEYYAYKYFSNPATVSRRKDTLTATAYTHALMQIKKRENDYDAVIDSTTNPDFTFNTGFLQKPVYYIFHLPVDDSWELYTSFFILPKNITFVFVSAFQAKQALFLLQNSHHIIHNGVDITTIDTHYTGSEETLWLGRIHQTMNKGILEALEATKRLQKKLYVEAFVEESAIEYFDNEVFPKIHSLVEFHNVKNYVPESKKRTVFLKKLFLFPTQFEEPFSLSTVEAMAAGTPVVAYARGALPEIVQDGKTGFLINPSKTDQRGNYIIKRTGIDGICEAIEKIYSLSNTDYLQLRNYCSTYVKKMFPLNKMIDSYEKLLLLKG